MQTRLQFLSNRGVFASGCKAGSHKKKAFTLIELLVVIAVIALLMSIIIPALKLAKQKGASVVCMAHVRQLTACWYMYQDENDGELVGSGNHSFSGPQKDKWHWVAIPYKANGTDCSPISGGSDPVEDEDEKRGIRDGALYPYIEAVDVFHCPGDNVRKGKDGGKIFRSYSMPSGLGDVHKFIRISTPGMRYCMVEEAEGRNFNVGAWEFGDPSAPIVPYWQDPIGIYHGKSGVLGFCDGHAESHKWADSNTVGRVQYYFDNSLSISNYGWGSGNLNTEYTTDLESGYDSTQVTDLQYMEQGWVRE